MLSWLLTFFGKSRKSSLLENLPNEILIEIAKYLTPRSLCPLLQASHRFYELLTRELHKHALEQKTLFPLGGFRSSWRGGDFPLLIWAVISKNYPLAYFLLGNGVDVNARGGIFLETSLHYAAREDDSCKFLNLLLENGADIEALDLDGRTPLHYAIEANATILIGKGANLEVMDSDFHHPFHLALGTQNYERLIRLYLRKGAVAHSRGAKRNEFIHSTFSSNNA